MSPEKTDFSLISPPSGGETLPRAFCLQEYPEILHGFCLFRQTEADLKEVGLFCCATPPASSEGSGELIAMPRIVKPFSNKREACQEEHDAKRAKSCFEQHLGELVHVLAIQSA